MKPEKPPQSIDEYIAACPAEVQAKLKQLRKTIKKIAPEVQEKISYGMPSFSLNGTLLYFAAHTNHIGLYPFPSAISAFRNDLKQYHTAKGSIQFPNDKSLPIELISKIVEFRVNEKRANVRVKSRPGKKNSK